MSDNPFTKFIIHGPIEELPYVVDLLNEAIPMFRRNGGRLGWGWHLNGKGKPSYFVREIKGGLSATRGWQGHFEIIPASVDERPEGQDPQALGAQHASAVGAAETPTPSPIDPLNVEEGGRS